MMADRDIERIADQAAAMEDADEDEERLTWRTW